MATSFQVYLLREFSAQFYGNELNYGFVLAAWLLWGGLGSLLAGRRSRRTSPATLALIYTVIQILLFGGFLFLRFSRHLLGLLPGEAVGMTPALGYSLFLSLLVNFPLGVCFVVNARLLGGDSSRVYFLESLGATLAGVGVHFVLIPYFSNWTGLGLVTLVSGLAAVLSLKPKRPALPVAATILVAGLFTAADVHTQKLAWRPLNLVRAVDTRFGKVQIFRTDGQVTCAANGLPVFSYPDPASAEETVHFAMVQRPEMRKVLLIGGSAGGAAAEILKYPLTEVECIELDPVMIETALEYLPAEARKALENPRVKLVFDDGRRYIKKAIPGYDAVMVSLPEPATAQVNRFYTLEFFMEVKRILAEGGVFSLTVASAENYISPDLGRFLAGLNRTLSLVFSEVEAVPGSNNVFLASDEPLSIDPLFIAGKLETSGVKNVFVNREMLPARLNPLRTEYLKAKLDRDDLPVNRDFTPVGYFFHSIWWAAQFKGPEAGLLRFFAGQPRGRILDLPLLLFALLLIPFAAARRNRPSAYLVPVAVLGITSIVVEMSVIMIFQASFGYLYGRISLLLGLFMAGLSAGSFIAIKSRSNLGRRLPAVQALKILLLIFILSALDRPLAEFLPFTFLFLEGALCGYLFVAANRTFQKSADHPGAAYAVDLLGSFFGVLIASSIIIPLWGVPALTIRLIWLNLICLAFILVSFRTKTA